MAGGLTLQSARCALRFELLSRLDLLSHFVGFAYGFHDIARFDTIANGIDLWDQVLETVNEAILWS